MLKPLSVRSLVLLLAAVTAPRAFADDCQDELMKHDYFGDPGKRDQRQARIWCTNYTKEQIAAAQVLYEKHYVEPFGKALEPAKRFTAEQIACAKKEFDASPADSRKFFVSDKCRDLTLAPTPGAAVVSDGKSVFDVLTKNGHAKTFLLLVEAAGLTDKLKAAGGITVFAMSDEAFAKEKPEYADWFIKHPDRLKRLVASMIAPTVVPSSKIEGDGRVVVPTLLNEGRKLTRQNDVIKVDSAAVSNKEIQASNGLIYLVDGDISRL